MMRGTVSRAGVWGALALLVAVAAGCSYRPPPTYSYLLAADRAAPQAPSNGGLSVGVRRLAVDAPYDNAGIVKRDGAEVIPYRTHRWAAPVSQMVTGALHAALAADARTGRVELVRGGEGDYDVIVSGRVVALEEVVEGAGSKVVVTLEVQAVRDGERRAPQAVTATRSLTAEQVREIVDALDELLADVVAEAADQLLG